MEWTESMDSGSSAGKPLPPIRRLIGAREVGAIGIGCTPMTAWYGDADVEEAELVLRRAHEYGITLIDTANVYGPETSEIAVGRAIRGIRDQVTLSTKGGLKPSDRSAYSREKVRDGRPEHLTKALEGSLRRLQVDHVDLYYLHKLDPSTPIEESIGAIAGEMEKGKVGAIGVCDVDTKTLDRASRVARISAVSTEISLWKRDALTEIQPWCLKNGVTLIPYTPLGRGYLTGAVSPKAKFSADDFRATNPRFTPDALMKNFHYVEKLKSIAQEHGKAPAAVALAWLLAQGPNVVPIPGMERLEYLEQNAAAAALHLTDEELDQLDSLPPAVGASR
jgi:aryl-alcohol dehydrogenase-like predicted oxidoreductase